LVAPREVVPSAGAGGSLARVVNLARVVLGELAALAKVRAR